MQNARLSQQVPHLRDQAEPRWAVQLPVQLPPSVDGAECSTVWGASGSELATAQKSCRVLKHGAALAAMQCRSLYAISFASSFTRHRSHRPLMHRLTLRSFLSPERLAREVESIGRLHCRDASLVKTARDYSRFVVVHLCVGLPLSLSTTLCPHRRRLIEGA